MAFSTLIEFARDPIVLGVIFSLIVAGFVKGAIGVGMPIVALPLLTLFIGIKDAVVLLTVPLILSNIPQSLEGGRTLQVARSLLPVILGMIPGLLIGVHLLVYSSLPVATVLAAAGSSSWVA